MATHSVKSVIRLALATTALALVSCTGSKNLEFSQIFVGANGPAVADIYFYDDADAVENSWISSALTPDQLQKVLKEVNFEHQVLLGVASGENKTSVRSINVTRVRQIHIGEDPPVDVTVQIGRCGVQVKQSRFFVLVALERPIGSSGRSNGYDLYYSDDCGDHSAAPAAKGSAA